MSDREAFTAAATTAYGCDIGLAKVVAGSREMRALVGGAGPAVVPLHGWPMTSHAWRFILPSLVESGRRVIAFGLPGLGHSDPASNGYDTAAVARDILAAVDALGIQPIALVGHDIGGMVSVPLALTAPDRIEALCCVETDAPGIGQWEEAQRDPHLWHLHSHATPALPEALIAGRERICINSSTIGTDPRRERGTRRRSTCTQRLTPTRRGSPPDWAIIRGTGSRCRRRCS